MRILAALGASAAVAIAPAAGAAKPKPTNVEFACADKGTGKLHYVKKASDCPKSRGKRVRFPDDFPVHACQRKTTPHELFRVSRASQCKAPEHPRTKAVTLPGTQDIKLCIGAAKGTLRVVGKYKACRPPDRRAVLRGLPTGRGTNVPPVVETSAGSTPYTEGAAAQTIDDALTVSDRDDTELEGATVSIAAGFQPGDELSFAAQPGIAGSYDSSTGVLTFTGRATVSEYRDLLRSTRFRTTLDQPGAQRAIGFTVDDGTDTSDPATKRIDITAVNDPPSLVATPDLRYYSEGDGPQPIDPGLSVSDPDSASLSGATVRVAAGFVPADDELSFTNKLGITGTYDDSTGVLTLTGTASLASYETALRSVRYENTDDDPHGAKPIAFQVTDAGTPPSTSKSATRTVKLIATDDAPVVTTTGGSSTYSIGTGAPVAVDAALEVTDADDASLEGARVSIVDGFQPGDTLAFFEDSAITGTYDSSTGVLTLTGTASTADYKTALRSITFSTTNGSPSTSRTISFVAYDGSLPSNESTKDIALVP